MWLFQSVTSSSFLLFTLVTGLSSCATTPPTPSYTYVSQVFTGSYDQVWRAAQLALRNYPMRVNNMDAGHMQTDLIKGYEVWTPPHKPTQKSGGLRYFISLRATKGDVESQPAVKLTVRKVIQLQRDFFADPENLSSDGLEEKEVLYRIERELIIDRALAKAQAQSQVPQSE